MRKLKLGAKIMSDNKIKILHDDDLVNYFKSLGIYEKFISNETNCIFCDNIINFNNFHAILPYNNEIVFCCNDPVCQFKLVEEREVE